MMSHPIIDTLQKQIIVSSQASQGEPLNTPHILCAMAESALIGGAAGIRMAQAENLAYFRERHSEIPLIGITKPDVIPANAAELIFITPDFSAIRSIAPYCDIVALDATMRPRASGAELETLVIQTRKAFPDILLMADIATKEDALNAEALGFDFIGTTLCGYTSETAQRPSKQNNAPDFELLAAITSLLKTPVIMEGRLWEPAQVTRVFELGAHAAVIGSAVTRPYEITKRFVQAAR